MATTHAYAGLALAIASLPVTGRYAPTSGLLLAAFVGGLLPDLDLTTSHRKTLHYPVIYPVVAGGLLAISLTFGSQSLFLLAVLAGSAGLHSLTDILGGGIGYEPWTGTSKKAVYNHVLGRWHVPRRVVRYSGAPEDFALCVAVAVPTLLAQPTDATMDAALGILLVGSGLYTATRRQFSLIASSIRTVVPSVLLECLPRIRFEDG